MCSSSLTFTYYESKSILIVELTSGEILASVILWDNETQQQ